MTRDSRNAVSEQLAEWQGLRRQLDAPDIDPQTMLDTLEGATDLHEALIDVAKEVMEREAANVGLSSLIADLQDRKRRNESTADALRTIILQAMDTAGIPQIKSDFCTLSKRDTKGKLVVVDEALIPAKFFVPQEPVLDKKALSAALEAKEEVAGATLSNGGISLTIRVK